MKVLAIIPACEGSKELPNKNLRVIKGIPMICYTIRNALSSRYITDVIVSSNSKELLSIARQMGAITRERCQDLCNPKVSIDKVVWDVFNQVSLDDYDCVVTMQPISPTLKAETLDKAFEMLFSQGFDTVISVRNQAHFYWTVKDDVPVPMQSKRVNRHLLDPFYKETGAFLISRNSCIREDSRIGKKVGLYELFGDEAIDVYSFGDLKQVENAMNRQLTAFYVNGNETIGIGHITRSLQIADEMFSKPDIYYDSNKTTAASFGQTTYNLVPVDGDHDFVERMRDSNYDIIINDVLSTERGFMQSLKAAAPNARIINFEDEGDGASCADYVINALYENSSESNAICGSRYFIIPKQFLIYHKIDIGERVKNVIVTFGGADPQNYTETVLNIISQPVYKDVHFYVVVGKINKRIDLISRFDSCSNIAILYDIDNMAEIMCRCDVAISSRGRTCFELAALGIPTLSIAQHEREERHTFVCEANGFVILAPESGVQVIENAIHDLVFSESAKRQGLQDKMIIHDLRSGRRNIANILNNLEGYSNERQ